MLLQDESSIVRRYLDKPFARSAFEAQRIYVAFNSDVLFKVVDFRQIYPASPESVEFHLAISASFTAITTSFFLLAIQISST